MVCFINHDFTLVRDDEADKSLKEFMCSDAVKNYPYPALVDADKAKSLLSGTSEKNYDDVLALSRFSFMGTDGMRGKVSLDEMDERKAFVEYTTNNLITRPLIKAASHAFARMCEERNIEKKVCIGNDSRDLAFDWALETALKEAFMEAGFSVVNLGVIPTPYIPCYMLSNKIRAGAVLTASHNPSNQNGIKFFLDSKKLLSDGENGDYILSAYMVEEALNGFKSNGTCDICENVDYTDYAADFLTGIVPSDFADIVKNSVIYVDTANGAWSVTAEKYFSKANIKVNLLNHKTEGFNINRNCGVAEIEGHACFSAGEIDSSPEVVQKVYAEGKYASYNVYGIAVDGDGDRGFAMKYDKTSDSVIVYDGDAEAYLVSELLGLKDKKAVFTIESDIMAGLEMQRKFNLEPVMVDVGDKWICNQNANELALGFESSGHFILPCKVEGTNELLLSGNGLLTALLSVAALEKGIVPFERGFSETFYTYYVNKNLFRYGSELWKQDEVTICEGFKSAGFEMQKVTMKDFNVLAFYAKENDKVVGLVFIRNSGTEDKNAVYLKCCKGFEKRLLPVVEKIVSVHKDCMRDVSREEVKCENEILDLIKKNGSVKAEQLSFSTGVAVSAFHALVKEKVICCKSDEYFLL